MDPRLEGVAVDHPQHLGGMGCAAARRVRSGARPAVGGAAAETGRRPALHGEHDQAATDEPAANIGH